MSVKYTIGKSFNSSYFTLNGIDLPKWHYYFFYDLESTDDNIRDFVIRHRYTNQNLIVSRGFSEVANCDNWDDLLRLVAGSGMLVSNDVNIQDQSTEIIDLHISRQIQPIALNNNYSIDDRIINITASQLPVVENIVCLKEGKAFYQGEILTVSNTGGNTYDIELDSPIDFDYTILGGCSERNQNLAVDGSTSPIIFSVSPSGLSKGVKWDITRVMGSIISRSSMDDSKFGGIEKLDRGILLRTKDGVTKNIFNAKTNSDLKAHMYDVVYSDKSPAGQYGLNFRRTFAGQSKNGVTIRLDADHLDSIDLIVQDDLTDLELFQLIAQGHIVE